MTTAAPTPIDTRTLPLFTEAQLPPPPAPPRPKHTDSAVLDAAVELLWPSVLGWLSREGPYPASDHDACKRDLRRNIGWCHDGYAFAKYLDSWSPDADLVEILGDASARVHQAHDDAVKRWVATYKIKAPLPVGTRVRFTLRGARHEGETYAGPHYVATLAATAQYLVFCEALGHVRSGDGSHGVFLNAEDVEQVE